MLEKLEVVRQILHGFDYTSFFKAEVKDKLSIILCAEDFILSTDDKKVRFIKEVTLLSPVSYTHLDVYKRQVLTPGRYVGLPEEDDDFDFEERVRKLTAELKEYMEESAKLDERIKENLAKVGIEL